MKKIFLIAFILISVRSFGSTITAVMSGNWLTTSTWGCGCLPTGSDNVVIPAAYNVTITAPGILLNGIPQILVTVNGILTMNSSLLTLDANDVLRINPSGKIVAIGTGGGVVSGLSTVGISSGNQIVGPQFITNGTLPITLLSFTATSDQGTITVKWTSTTEKNLDFYTIQRSSDGVQFENLAEVKGSGNSTSRIDYSYVDEKPNTAKLYYRLKATDFDGTNVTYNVVAVGSIEWKNNLTVFPNPVTDNTLRFQFNVNPNPDELVVLRSVNGVVVEKFAALKMTNEINLSTGLEKGIFFVEFVTLKGTSRSRIIIH